MAEKLTEADVEKGVDETCNRPRSPEVWGSIEIGEREAEVLVRHWITNCEEIERWCEAAGRCSGSERRILMRGYGGVKEIIYQAKDHDASLLFIWPMNPLICSAERFATITL